MGQYGLFINFIKFYTYLGIPESGGISTHPNIWVLGKVRNMETFAALDSRYHIMVGNNNVFGSV